MEPHSEYKPHPLNNAYSDQQKHKYYESLLGELSNYTNGYTDWENFPCPIEAHKNTNKKPFGVRLGAWNWNCCACGKGGDIVELQLALGRSLKEFNEIIGAPAKGADQVKTTYHYANEDGIVTFRVHIIRYANGDKQTDWSHLGKSGEWVEHKAPEKRYLYQLDKVVEATEVWVVEGEKCVELLYPVLNPTNDPSIAVTTSPGGANAWKDEYADSFKKVKNIFVVPDNNAPGFKYANRVAESASSRCNLVKIVHLPGLAEDQDIQQFIALHGNKTKDELLKLAERAELYNKAWLFSDADNAEFFAHKYKEEWSFDPGRGWMRCNGIWWKRDEAGEITNIVTECIRMRTRPKLAQFDLMPEDPKEQKSWGKHKKELEKWAVAQESVGRIKAGIELARGRLANKTEWDSNLNLTATLNGVIDVDCPPTFDHKNGKMWMNEVVGREGSPKDRITKQMNVKYNPKAKCPKFEQFMQDIMLGDAEMIAYLQRALGYSCLTGSVKEQVSFLCCGGGSNGKNTLLDVLVHILGDYGWVTAFDTFTDSMHSGSPGDLANLARLAGTRLVIASEAPANATLSSSRLKGFVHGDPQNAKFMGQNHFNFKPQGKLWMTTNEMPAVKDQSHGFWRSIQIIPFEAKFEGVGDDKDMKTKLLEEDAGLLNWLIQGYVEYKKMGLMPPGKVAEATKQYRADNDPLAEFIADKLEIGDGLEVKASEVWSAYVAWCEAHSVKYPLSRKKFGMGMKLQHRPWKAEDKSFGIHYRGIQLKF